MLLLLLLLLLLRRLLLVMIGALMLLPTMLLPFVAAYRGLCGRFVFDTVFRSACTHQDVGIAGSLVAAMLGLIWRNDQNPPGSCDMLASWGGVGRVSLGRVAHAGDLPSREAPVRCHARTGRVEPHVIQGKPG